MGPAWYPDEVLLPQQGILVSRAWQTKDGLDAAPSGVSEICALNDAWSAAAAKRDLDGMLAIYAEDACELLPGLPTIAGRDEIRSFYGRLLRDLPRFQHAFTPYTATVADSGDLVVMRGSYRFVPDADDPSTFETGKYVGVWCRIADEWRLVLNISNGDGEPHGA